MDPDDSRRNSLIKKQIENRMQSKMDVFLFFTEANSPLSFKKFTSWLRDFFPNPSEKEDQVMLLRAGVTIGPYVIDWGEGSLVYPHEDFSSIEKGMIDLSWLGSSTKTAGIALTATGGVLTIVGLCTIFFPPVGAPLTGFGALALTAGMAMLAFHFYLVALGRTQRQALIDVADLCTSWNRNETFTIDRNSQHFLQELIPTLNIEKSAWKDSKLQEILEKIRLDGATAPLLGSKTFTDAKQLDEFVRTNWNQISQLQQSILGAYFFAFQRKSHAEPQNPNWKTGLSAEECKTYFQFVSKKSNV